MENKLPLITVVVVFHNEERNLPALLQSFKDEFQNDANQALQFLFIDNNSSDQSIQKVQQSWLFSSPYKTALVRRRTNHMAKARQQALEVASTPWVLFLDADTLLVEGWKKNVFRRVEEAQESTVVIGGGEVFFGEQSWHLYAKSLAHYFPMGKKPGKITSVSHVPTNNCLMRRQAALDVGGFNAFFHRVGEDLDISVRLRQAGEIQYTQSFQVRHRLKDPITSWYQKMALYGRAQSYVILENRGGLAWEKFIPLALLVTFLMGLLAYPLVTASAFVLSLLIPRLQFFVLSFMFYGLGELVGFFRFFLLKMSLKSSVLLTDRA